MDEQSLRKIMRNWSVSTGSDIQGSPSRSGSRSDASPAGVRPEWSKSPKKHPSFLRRTIGTDDVLAEQSRV